ncbi:hypothetical protein HRW14_24455 [Streptomyces lunaelactis]|uniref:hypothetical protein n=1 Tax=Streptomyces lunaelactis TaxID=1535768 RepID=UPI001585CD21|nr:hypothetical protein [Streptomyces lunaelactis]NUK53367.1 hypothetical protein [Streptomyces lunaelactis]
MSEATAHRPDYSFTGEPCASVGDLQPGDQIPVLGGAAVLSVLEVSHDTEAGATTLRIDASPSGPGPLLLSSGSLVNVRRPEPAQAEDAREDDEGEEVTVTVSLTVTEQVTYEFEAEMEIPAGVAGDADELHEYLADNEDLWLDSLDPLGANGSLSVNERSLDDASVVLAA